MVGFGNDISLIILAGLLSLLPVVILFWAYYLREREPSVPGRVVTRFFAAGMLTVLPAVILERGAFTLSQSLSPVAASAFFTDVFSLEAPRDLLLAFFIAFGVVALAEEGVRYLFLRALIRRSGELDQVVDGLQVGIATGIGFAFVENTLYFLRLFQRLDFNTLVVVFFLRFLLSTFGHISFGGIMGVHLVRAAVHPTERRRYLALAFFVPWMAHGLFNLLLSIRLTAYTVLFQLLPLAYLWALYRAPQLHERFRLHGRLLKAPVHGRAWTLFPWRRPAVEPLPTMPWCPTCFTPLAVGQERCQVCGTMFHQKPRPSPLPFAPASPRSP